MSRRTAMSDEHFHLLTNPAQFSRTESNLQGEGEVREAGRLLRRTRLQGCYRIVKKAALRLKPLASDTIEAGLTTHHSKISSDRAQHGASRSLDLGVRCSSNSLNVRSWHYMNSCFPVRGIHQIPNMALLVMTAILSNVLCTAARWSTAGSL